MDEGMKDKASGIITATLYEAIISGSLIKYTIIAISIKYKIWLRALESPFFIEYSHNTSLFLLDKTTFSLTKEYL